MLTVQKDATVARLVLFQIRTVPKYLVITLYRRAGRPGEAGYSLNLHWRDRNPTVPATLAASPTLVTLIVRYAQHNLYFFGFRGSMVSKPV